METYYWILISTAVFLGACALFVPYLAEIIKRKAFAPKLKILFKLSPPFCLKTYWRSTTPTAFMATPSKGKGYERKSLHPTDTSSGSMTTVNWGMVLEEKSTHIINEPVYYFRFQVINEGKSQARKCEVVLENLWIFDSAGRPKSYTNFSAVNMHWSGKFENEQYIDINPNRKVYCDIGHISSENYQREKESKNIIDIPEYKGNDLRFILDLTQIFYSQPNCLVPGRYILQFTVSSENAKPQKLFFDISWSGKWQDSEPEMFNEIVISQIKSLT